MFDVVKTVWATGIWTSVHKQLSILLSYYSVSPNVYSVPSLLKTRLHASACSGV